MPKILVPSLKVVEKYIKAGKNNIAGVDEVGRGSLAGPLVAAAVILPKDTRIYGVRDSKVLDIKQREKLAIKIKQKAAAVGIGWVSNDYIDTYGLSTALTQVGKLALEDMHQPADFVLLDGKFNYLQKYYEGYCEVDGDSTCLPIACASIVAKVARDNYMKRLSKVINHYGFETNVGYGTKQHYQALQAVGISHVHRKSFAPVGEIYHRNLSVGI